MKGIGSKNIDKNVGVVGLKAAMIIPKMIKVEF